MRPPNIFAHVDPDDRPNITGLEVTNAVTIEIGSVYLFFKDAAHAEQFVTDCDRGLTDMPVCPECGGHRRISCPVHDHDCTPCPSCNQGSTKT